MAKKSTQLIIKHHQPFRYWFIIIMYVSAVGVAGWFLYSFAQMQAGFDNTEMIDEIDRLVSENSGMQEEAARLREQIAILERSRQVEKGAYAEVDDNLNQFQQEILELKETVAFYRGILSPNESAAGMSIQSLKIEKTQNKQMYRYKLVLTQVMKNVRSVKGDVDLTVEGLMDGKSKKLEFPEITTGKKENLKLSFKYFQTFEGNITLPKDFSPSRIFVHVTTSGKSKGDIKKTFEWNAILT